MKEKNIIKITEGELVEAISNATKKVIEESNIKRIEKWVNEKEIAIITAWRGQFVNLTPKTDIPSHISHNPKKRSEKQVGEPFSVGDSFSTEEKKYYNRALKSLLLSYGYGVTNVRGKWIGNFPNNMSSDDEESFFVVNIDNDPDFKDKIFKLSEKFNQDAFAYSPLGTNEGYVIGTNASSWPGYGNTVLLGNFTPNIIAQSMTSIKNRAFSFTNQPCNKETPKTFQDRKRERMEEVRNIPIGIAESIDSYNVIARRLIKEEAQNVSRKLGI